MTMADDYQPAITMDKPAPAEKPAPAPRAAFAQPAAEPEVPAPADGEPPPDTSRGPREVSDKVRGMLRTIVKAAVVDDSGVSGVADDLVPMGTDSPPAAAGPAAAGAAPASPAGGVPAAVPAAPTPGPVPAAQLPQLRMPQGTPAATVTVQPGAVGSAAEEQRRALLDQRERELENRQKQIDERLKNLPTLERLAEAPAATITAWLKDTFGITDPGELKTLVGDIMTEASEQLMDAKLPPDLKAQLEGRKAVRSVRAVKAGLDARERALEVARAEAEKTSKAEADKREAEARDRQLAEHIGAQLAPHAATWKFLHDQRVTRGVPPGVIVHEVYKEQERLFKAGLTQQQPDLAVAAKFADDYYRSQAEAAAKEAAYFQSLLAPAAQPAPPAKPQPSPGGEPGPSPTTQPKPPTPAPTVDVDASDLSFHPDRQERRHQSLARLKARFTGGAS